MRQNIFFSKPALLLLLAFSFMALQHSKAQNWQQRVDYDLKATLNDTARTLEGFAAITYHNNSPDTLRHLFFHLWPNAYKNDRTALSEQLLRLGETDFYFAGKEKRGYINRLDFKVNGTRVTAEEHEGNIDVVRLLLPHPLAPGGKALITTPYFVKLPFNFSRGGYDGNSFQLTQWYPKPALYDYKGWHPMPYLHQGEFYSNFGRFDVQISLPAKYVVAATGIQVSGFGLHNAGEAPAEISTHSKAAEPKKKFTRKPTSGKLTGTNKRKPETRNPQPETPMQTLRYVQDSVHDFAIFANPEYKVQRDTCLLPSGRIILVQAYYTPEQQAVWKNSLNMLKEAVRYRSRLVGEYPYGVVTAVQGPESFGGGMEYPTINIISLQQDAAGLAELIGHEVGHNWFQGILASNERDFPWLDEGLNSYYDRRHRREMDAAFEKNKISAAQLTSRAEELLLQTKDTADAVAAYQHKICRPGRPELHAGGVYQNGLVAGKPGAENGKGGF